MWALLTPRVPSEVNPPLTIIHQTSENPTKSKTNDSFNGKKSKHIVCTKFQDWITELLSNNKCVICSPFRERKPLEHLRPAVLWIIPKLHLNNTENSKTKAADLVRVHNSCRIFLLLPRNIEELLLSSRIVRKKWIQCKYMATREKTDSTYSFESMALLKKCFSY